MFTVPHPKTGELTTFRIKGRRFTPGKDFKVYNAETHEKVAEIDDRKLNIGGRVTIRFRGEEEFEDVMSKISAVAKRKLEVSDGGLVMTKVVGGFIAHK